MSSSLLDPLYRAATLTFEEMALLYATPLQEPIDMPVAAEVAVAFTGPLCGRVVVRTYGGVLPVLAANLLGEDDEPPQRLQADALGEVANVICGNLLPAIGGPEAVFRLAAPSMGDTTAGGGEFPDLPVADVSLDLECGRAQILLFLTDGGPGSSP